MRGLRDRRCSLAPGLPSGEGLFVEPFVEPADELPRPREGYWRDSPRRESPPLAVLGQPPASDFGEAC